jgi:hypothetical protein
MEVLIHCANLYKTLGADPNSQIELRMRYGGLRDRYLTSPSLQWIDRYHGENTHEDLVSVAPIRFRLGGVDTELTSLVKRLCAPLFVIFGYTEVRDEDYERIMADFTAGRLQ